MGFSLEAVGVIHCCFKDKFGVPRQPGLINSAHARLEFYPPYNQCDAFTGLDEFSHIWIHFVFHHCLGQQTRLSVRPPRLGGNRKIGVFASRSTHRPNPIGLSVVKLAGIEKRGDGISLILEGVDLVDGTPVLDIKPYIPDVDAISDAQTGYAQQAPEARFNVIFTPQAEQQCYRFTERWPDLKRLIVEVLSLDPRPAYLSEKSGNRQFAIRLYQLDVQWRVLEINLIEVLSIELVAE